MTEKSESKSVESSSDKGAAMVSRQMPFPMSNLRDEVDRVFDRFMGGGWPFSGPRFRSLADWDPFKSVTFASPDVGPTVRADVAETDAAYEITLELPGIDEKDVEVNVSEDIVTIKGEKKFEKETTEKDRHVTERSYGGFRREFRMPASVDQDKVDASFSKGVLKVTLPKTEEAQRKPRKIEVKAN
ncbi:MAG: Hsp20/alpha crystallin family protein [Gammaproteobacteria bacterium]